MPVPRYRYVPVLRWKRGEKVGVRNVAPTSRQGIVPLFLLAPTRYVGKAATKSHPAIAPANFFAQEMATIWGTLPFFLDASEIPHSGGGHHPFAAIAARARTQGLSLIPATWLGAPAPYQQAVNAAVSVDHRGVGLRVDLQELTSAATWIAAWPHQPNQTHLLVDFGSDVITVAALGNSVTHAFASLHQAANWRSVTIIGTSMPDTFQGWQQGLHTIPRTEWLLWQTICATSLPYRLDYGDYATVPTTPAPVGIQWGYPISVRYTLEDKFLICRGVRTTGIGGVDMDQQLVTHATSIVQYPQRAPLAHCWADTRIDNIAAGNEPPRGLEAWVQIGVNRHIELTRNRLP